MTCMGHGILSQESAAPCTGILLTVEPTSTLMWYVGDVCIRKALLLNPSGRQ